MIMTSQGTPLNETIVKRIKDTRIERGLTQQDLANQLGRTAASISDLERGKVQITASDLFQLARYLNKPIEYFYGEEYFGEDVEDLISIIRRIDPDTRKLQLPIIKSILLLQQKVDDINSIDKQNEESLKSVAEEIYKLLIPYLINLTELRSKAFTIKAQLEEILDIKDNPNL
jgi:transcriptional regulator with XRE-family HTH domain